ncbi:MAG: Replicative DNA helicase [Chlamydiae bacterium]|nr:Replicative DNA helicase [Chlamydiota bacterium]
MVDKAKIAPNSKESEMMVLGCMLTSINSLNIAADLLDDTDFYYTEHKLVFQILHEAYKKDKPADVHLVCEELKRMEKLESIGGASYVTTLAQYAGTSAYIEQYAQIVKSKAILRQMIRAAQIVEKNALEEPSDVGITLDDAQQMFFKISQRANPESGVLVSELLSGTKAFSQLPYLKELQQRQEQFQTRGPEESGITGIPTHFMDVDKVINGLNNSHLIILAARPAMGKTAFALNIAENVCFKNNMPVGIFSLEMTAEQLLHRVICSQAEVESDKIQTGALSGVEFQRIVSCVSQLQNHTMIIDDQPGLRVTDLRARARRMKEVYDIKLLIIDYLQLLSGSGSNRNMEKRQNEISEISRMLKTLARELDIPIITISQLSRKVDERAGHRPMMSDLRESGCLTGDSLIQDADTGKLYTIKELAERKEQTPINVHAVEDNFKVGKHKLTRAFHSGKKRVYELKTKSGRTIKASSNHPFLKLNGWTSLEQLKQGDRIAIPRKIDISNPTSSINEDELSILAHLIGDGCILPRQPYHYTSEDEENLEIVSNISERLFNISPRLVQQKNWYHLYLPSPFKLTHNKYHPITEWFNRLGVKRVRSYEKSLPLTIFQTSEKKIALFLKHLWATDGNISSKILKGRKPSAAIYYASSSPVLAKQVHHLLLHLGIHSTLKTVPSKKGYRDMYHVHIQGKEAQTLFLEKVGSVGKRGHQTPRLLEELSEIKANPNNDTIPKEAWSLFVTPAKEQNGFTWRQVCEKLGMSFCGSTLFKHGISRNRMQRLYAVFQDQSLLNLAESDLYWDEIASITELGIEDVYDATVENVHNFVANDIIVHNSIEQDSDILMFLLRREYYDPNDKPGMAELIIAKNRHGGIGNINLNFVKELAQFRNYTPIHVNVDEDAPYASF